TALFAALVLLPAAVALGPRWNLAVLAATRPTVRPGARPHTSAILIGDAPALPIGVTSVRHEPLVTTSAVVGAPHTPALLDARTTLLLVVWSLGAVACL